MVLLDSVTCRRWFEYSQPVQEQCLDGPLISSTYSERWVCFTSGYSIDPWHMFRNSLYLDKEKINIYEMINLLTFRSFYRYSYSYSTQSTCCSILVLQNSKLYLEVILYSLCSSAGREVYRMGRYIPSSLSTYYNYRLQTLSIALTNMDKRNRNSLTGCTNLQR